MPSYVHIYLIQGVQLKTETRRKASLTALHFRILHNNHVLEQCYKSRPSTRGHARFRKKKKKTGTHENKFPTPFFVQFLP
jgi:hypothetical protein